MLPVIYILSNPGFRKIVWILSFSECSCFNYGRYCTERCSCNFANTKECDRNTGACKCKPGWEGKDCDTDIKECTKDLKICGDNAKCHETPGSYYCICDVGYKKDKAGACVGMFHMQRGKEVI